PTSSAPAVPDSVRPPEAARHAWAASVAAAWTLLSAPAVLAQTTATIDVGVSSVRYDGFLPSAAASVSPALRWEQPSGTLTARGTYLRFESGHRSLQGLVAGSFLIRPAGRRWRGELGGSVGASRYLDFASFWHATADARLHLLGADRGVWIGATAGRTAYGAGARPVTSAGVGAWAQRSQVMLSASATRSFVGDSAYSDFLATALTRPGAVTLDASLGDPVPSARLRVVPQPGGAVRLVLHVAGAAASVELAGDFTDWQPWPLRRRGDGMWETVLPIPSGLHRLNVRIDGGAWIVPAGLSRAADDYGDDVGILAVP